MANSVRLFRPAPVGFAPDIAQHLGGLGLGEDAVVVTADDLAPLREVESVGAVERDGSDEIAVGRAGDIDFKLRIVGKAAIGIEADRPNLRAFGDRVIEPFVLHGDGKHAAALSGEAPCRRVLDVEGGTLDIHASRSIVGHGLKAGLGAARRAMVEGAAVAAVEAETMDEAGLEVADEKLLRCGIISNGTKAGTGIVLAVMGDVGEERDEAGHAVDLPDRAGRAAFVEAELTRHPPRARLAFDQALALAVTICRPNSEVAVT